MPFYYIIIELSNKITVRGVREHHDHRIDLVWRLFEAEAHKHYTGSQIKSFDCMMLSKQSAIYQKCLSKRHLRKTQNNLEA